MRRVLAWILAGAAMLIAIRADADCSPRLSTCINADTLAPLPGRFAFVGEAALPHRFELALRGSYLHEPIRLEVPTAGPKRVSTSALDEQVTVTAVGGVVFADRAMIYGAIPATVQQGGAGTSAVTGAAPAIAPRGVQDPRAGGAVAIVPRVLSVFADAQIPISAAEFSGERGVVIRPVLAFEEHAWRITIEANAGARIPTAPQRLLDVREGPAATGALGLGVDVVRHLALQAEARTDVGRNSHFEWLGSVRAAFFDDQFSIIAGGSLSRAFIGIGYAR
jgi:hypothetical protein